MAAGLRNIYGSIINDVTYYPETKRVTLKGDIFIIWVFFVLNYCDH